jgi:hypothetical protein
MSLLRIACAAILLLAVTGTRAQEQPLKVPSVNGDSIKAGIEMQMRNAMADMQKNIFNLGGKQFFKSRIDKAMNRINQFDIWKEGLGFNPAGLFKKKFLENTSGNVEYSNRIGRQSPDEMQVFDRTVVAAGVTLAKIPLKVDYTRIDEKVEFDHSLHNFNTNFSKDEFIGRLQARLKEKFNSKDLLKEYDLQIDALKNNASSSLKQELSGLKEKYKEIPGVPQELLNGNWDVDISSLTARTLNPQLTEQINEKKELLSQLQSRARNGKAVDTASMNSVMREIDSHNGVMEVVAKVMVHKNKWENNAIVKKIREMKLQEQGTYEKLFSNPASIRKYAAQYLQLSGLEKLFLDVKKLGIGQNPVDMDPLTLQNHLSKGLNLEMTKRNKYFMMLSGRQQDPAALYNFSYNDVFNHARNMVNGLRFGFGDLNSSYSHLSFFTYQAMPSGSDDMMGNNPAIQRTNFVATLSNRLDLGQGKYLEAELSRSAMQFRNVDPEAGNTDNNKSGFGNLINTNGLEDLAVMVRYRGAAEKAGLIYDVKVARVGNGYNNPGNHFLATGQKELAASVKKTFLKRKLQLGLKGQVREYKFSQVLNNKWVNANYTLEAKWNLKKGQSISVRYQPISNVRTEDGVKYTASRMDRLSVQGNLSKTLWGNYYRSTVMLAYLRNDYNAGAAGLIRNASLQFNVFQNMAIGNNLYYWNVTYQYAKNEDMFAFMNSALTTDMGITYNVFKGINCSSGLCYNDVAGWYRQAGVRQSINGSITKKLELGLFVDGRINLREYNPLFYTDLLQANVQIKYLIK